MAAEDRSQSVLVLCGGECNWLSRPQPRHAETASVIQTHAQPSRVRVVVGNSSKDWFSMNPGDRVDLLNQPAGPVIGVLWSRTSLNAGRAPSPRDDHQSPSSAPRRRGPWTKDPRTFLLHLSL